MRSRPWTWRAPHGRPEAAVSERSMPEEFDDLRSRLSEDPEETATDDVVGDVAGGVPAVRARLRVALDGSGLHGAQAAAFRPVEEELRVLEEQVRAQDLRFRQLHARVRDFPARAGVGAATLRDLQTMAGLSTTGGGLLEALHTLAVLTSEIHQQSSDPTGPASVSIIVGQPQAPQLLTCSSPHAQRLEGLQFAAEEGPSFEAARGERVVTTPDLFRDERWPRLHTSEDLDRASCIAAPLLVDDQASGVLALYAPSANPVTEQTINLIKISAAKAQSLLLEHQAIDELATTRDQLQQALVSRAVIDQAKGMIMMVRGCDANHAFDYLVTLSNARNEKLREVAAGLVNSDPRELETTLPRTARPVRSDVAADHACQMGGPGGHACYQPAAFKLTDSWGDTAWSCLPHADEALVDARGVFLATKDLDGLAAYLTRRWRTGRSQPSNPPIRRRTDAS
jgi:hypothetical protein